MRSFFSPMTGEERMLSKRSRWRKGCIVLRSFFLADDWGGTDGVQEIQVAEKLRWHSGYVSFAPLSGFFILV